MAQLKVDSFFLWSKFSVIEKKKARHRAASPHCDKEKEKIWKNLKHFKFFNENCYFILKNLTLVGLKYGGFNLKMEN